MIVRVFKKHSYNFSWTTLEYKNNHDVSYNKKSSKINPISTDGVQKCLSTISFQVFLELCNIKTQKIVNWFEISYKSFNCGRNNAKLLDTVSCDRVKKV